DPTGGRPSLDRHALRRGQRPRTTALPRRRRRRRRQRYRPRGAAQPRDAHRPALAVRTPWTGAGERPSDMTPPTSAELLAGKHRTMADTATERRHEAIVAGDIPPGTPLRLIDLSERLGMSSMPVREAIRRLESIGFVTVLPHRGAFVRGMTLEDFEDTISTRRLLECECAARAAE